jgi:hypothetical protein
MVAAACVCLLLSQSCVENRGGVVGEDRARGGRAADSAGATVGYRLRGGRAADSVAHSGVFGKQGAPGVPERPGLPERPKRPTVDDVILEKELLYDRYTLSDSFPYGDGVRVFQFDKMRARLFMLDSIQRIPSLWAVLQNRGNVNGESPLVKAWARNEYGLVSDAAGVERYQSVVLYGPGETEGECYGRDGSLVRLIGYSVDSTRRLVESYNAPGVWEAELRYVKPIAEGTAFRKAVMVDRTNQNIATVEKVSDRWLVRSMNPATTGLHNPPYAHPTPVGMFVVQEKKLKMYYNRDGTDLLAGYAPWASRFCNGAYLHGVPTNDTRADIIEFSRTLGTTPKSHMCVRNASSHAEFIYDFAPVMESVVFVYD